MDMDEYEDRPLIDVDASRSRRLHPQQPLHKRVLARAKTLSKVQIVAIVLVTAGVIYWIVRTAIRFDHPRYVDPAKILTFADSEFGKFCSGAKSESDATAVSDVPDSRVSATASCLNQLSHATPSEEVREQIRADKAAYGFQQTIDERALLYEGFRCFNFSMNLLVWGTGRDSTWFATVNKGKTRFLENLPDWLNYGNDELAKLDRDAKIIKVDFDTLLMYEDTYFKDMDALLVALPDEIWTTRWDYIIVDSPWGYSRTRGPGRMSSIVTSRFLHQCHELEAPYTAQVATVHDVNRKNEKTWGEVIYGRPLQCWQAMCLWKV